jgi:ATP-binding cassette subfamily C (CFTR/MRP) protein 1
VAASTFTVYVLLGHKLTADVIFPSLTLFNYLTWPILKLPEIVSKFSESRISILRLNKFLRREELPPVKLKTPDSLNGEDEDVVLSMKDAEFEWLVDEDPEEDEDEDSKDKKDKKKKSSVDEVELEGFEMIGIPGTSEGSNSSSKSESGKQLEKEKEQKLAFKLKGLNCEVKRGQLIAIIGRVGSGKSSMLSAMLGEMKQTQGEMWMTASQKGRGVSYVGQKAWICNASVRDNILFYNEYDQAKYRQVVKKCALQEDLKILPAGDKTEIGERGAMKTS